jgi:prepilin-type N-terminal cleavage/methylation domain-containing protein/prepilin-type processing-associated H-X9-DG protein
MRSSNRAFTLIELLVVIAIIAILAAILFPVFAQAKEAAKRTAALSSVKQIGTSSHMYATDHDDRFPSVYDDRGDTAADDGGGDPPVTMSPYLKNDEIWYSQARTDREDDGRRRRSYGYNWGFEIRTAGGMLDMERCENGAAVTACSGSLHRYNAGKSITQMEEPAKLFAFGDTYDTPRMTLGAVDDWITYKADKNLRDNSRLRYGGRFNIAFADSHAKAVPFKFGEAGGPVGWTGVPKSYDARLYGYCASLDEQLIPFIRSGNTQSMACRDVVALPEVYDIKWWPN